MTTDRPPPAPRGCLGCTPAGCLTILVLMGLVWIASAWQGRPRSGGARDPGVGPGVGIGIGADGRPTRATGSPAPAPVRRAGETVAVGQVGVLGGLTGAVWLAVDETAFDELLDAQNARSGPALYRLAEAGRVRAYAPGTRVEVVRRSGGASRVLIVAGDDQGEAGWVQSEFVRPAAAGP